MNTFERIFGWLFMPCILTALVIVCLKCRKPSSKDAKQKLERNLPAECRKLKLKVGIMREEMLERINKYALVFDTARITNETWAAEAKSLIAEAGDTVESYLDSVDSICADTRILLASTMPSNQWHEANINAFIDDVREEAEDGMYVFSRKNLHRLDRQYNLLTKYRKFLIVEDGEIAFTNDGLEWECVVIDDIDYPGEDDFVN